MKRLYLPTVVIKTELYYFKLFFVTYVQQVLSCITKNIVSGLTVHKTTMHILSYLPLVTHMVIIYGI